MDDRQFDRWTLALSERLSRRGLGRLGAGVLAALALDPVTSTGPDSLAKPNKRRKRRADDRKVSRRADKQPPQLSAEKKKKGKKKKKATCRPNCSGKTCGSNGCPGGSCGQCIGGEICSDQSRGGVCECPQTAECGSACCTTDKTCLGNACCPNARVCDDTCCAANQTCLDDACCPDEQACDGICCNGSQTCVDDVCCADANVCGNACCANTETCIGDACCANARICNAIACCTANQTCLESGCCPDSHVCNGGCCGANQTCIGAECCPDAQVCGAVCCESSQQVCDDAGACCTPEPAQVTCGEQCGARDNNCGQRIDCSEVCVSYDFVDAWGTFGSGNGEFRNPSGIAIGGDGEIYVADRGNSRIQQFTSSGRFIRSWGSAGSGPGQFDIANAQTGVAIDAAGSVYVVDTGNYRIQKFSREGAFLAEWNALQWEPNGLPHAIDVDGAGAVYVAVREFGRPHSLFVLTFTGGGVHVGTSEPNPPLLANGIAVDSRGRIFRSDGFGIAIVGRGRQLIVETPTDALAVDADDFLYAGAGSSRNIIPSHRIEKFDTAGNLVTTWGTEGSLPGQFSGVSGIAVASDGFVYVTDSGNHRVQKFAPVGASASRQGGPAAAESRANGKKSRGSPRGNSGNQHSKARGQHKSTTRTRRGRASGERQR